MTQFCPTQAQALPRRTKFGPALGIVVTLISLLWPALPAQAQLPGLATPTRIASVNICIDLLLWELVPHERLVSLSYLTASPMWSPISESVRARGVALNHGLAEELVPLQPEVVFAGEFDAREALELLERLNQRVERLPLPRTLSDIHEQVLQLGELVGEQARARQLSDQIQAQITQLAEAPKATAGMTAFWYSSNGVVIGAGTLEDQLMRLAGLRNLAAERGMQGFNYLDLELLLSAQPDLLIVEESNATAFSLAREFLAHPALEQADFKLVRLSAGLSGCAASAINDVAQALHLELKQ